MNAVILIVALANGGHWLGDQENAVTVQWAAPAQTADAQLLWDLRYAGTSVASGRVAMPAGEKPTRLLITVPKVRARAAMQWVYRVERGSPPQAITGGEQAIVVYPNGLLDDFAARFANKKLLVWDRPAGLPKLLAAAAVPHVRIDDGTALEVTPADVILVGPDQLDNVPFRQSPLLARVEAGASVLIFEQTRVSSLAGYTVTERRTPSKLQWAAQHPLAAHFELIAPAAELKVKALRLPVDEPALEIAFWPREVRSEEPAPIDALLVSKTIGRGRVVLCQIPLGPWESDPRSQLFLADALDYLLSRPEPTPPPSRRTRPEKPAALPPVPTIPLNPGVSP